MVKLSPLSTKILVTFLSQTDEHDAQVSAARDSHHLLAEHLIL